MKFEYTVTVIVPVYNAEKSIGRTMESLFQQTISQDAVEILLIDDGSTDGSPQLCDRYAQEHDNVRVIHQENQGVSAARNAGIRNARGKYLLYLDGDDTLSPESLLNITNFFELHYDEVDLVTYPLVNRYEDGTTSSHWRYGKYLTKTGIYALEKFPHIAQTTINVCVKNTARNQLFDMTMALAEDQLHNAMILSKSAQIGFVKAARYNYFRADSSSSSLKSRLPKAFDTHISAYRQFLDLGDANKKIQRYCESTVLYNLNWRLTGDNLLPYHLSGQKYKEAMSYLTEILNRMSNRNILNYPHMDMAYRYYLLSLKTKNRPLICSDISGLKVIDNTGELSGQATIQIVITQIEATSDGIYMLAYIKCFAFAFTEEMPQLVAVLPNATRKKIPIFYSQFSSYWTKFETNHFYAFHFSYQRPQLGDIRFEVSLRGRRYPTNFWYSAKGRVHPDIGCGYLEGSPYGLFCEKSSLQVVPANAPALLQAKRTFEKTLFEGKRKQWLARRLMKLAQNRRVWLYFDSHDSLDNGCYQFLHDIEKNDGIRRYYVYHADNPKLIEGKFSGKAKRSLIQFGSVQHKCLMAAAEKVLVAFADWPCYLPFDPVTYQYYSDLFHYDVIYLQHGVMHAKLPNMYSKEKAWQINQIVASTTFEKENLLHLGYREEDILTCGMPRLDALVQNKPDKKRLLFAPSWRVSLVKTVNSAQTPVEGFYQSDYYQEFSAFLRDENLHNLLEKYDLYLDVQIHPMFSCYADGFLPAGLERIQMTHSANASNYMACITDFSSFMFDFVYLDKPVISYFPDREAFQAGSHSYSDFYYPLEDGFTLYCEEKAAAIDLLRQLCEDSFSLPPKLAERANGIYFSREANHMEKLYRTLMGDK